MRGGLLLLAVALLLASAACGGAGTGTNERSSRLDARVDAVLDDEGFGDARNVQCPASGQRRICTVDIPLGPDMFRETYLVVVNAATGETCWEARQVGFERLTGREAESLAMPHRLEGCFS